VINPIAVNKYYYYKETNQQDYTTVALFKKQNIVW